ncbi:MAG: autotransporter-associated beta strand repeat-containing protein [Pirellulales bacterium]|nr:autotransporter-associated beta strand repeat-containing protein [Pirellulales bacterium]
MKNNNRILVCGAILATLLGCAVMAEAAQVTLALSPASGTTNRLPITLSAPVVSDQTKTTSLSGSISANLNFAIDSATHQINSSGITGISFNKQVPGQISMSDLHYSWSILFIVVQTVDITGLKATPYTPVPPGPVTQIDAANYQFPASSHALEINQGNIVWAGYENGSQNCTTVPISGLTLDSTSTLTFNRTADSLTSSTFTVGLNMPVNFTETITTDVVMSTSGGYLVATGAYNQTYANSSAYWDASTAAGLQAGNGTWSTASSAWSTGTQGSNPLYAWTADAGTVNAYFNPAGASAIAVSGGVAAQSMNINGAGYTFSGGTITVNSGGITANESASIASAVTLGGSQTWTAAASKTLAVSGNISGGLYTLTAKGAGAVNLSGVNSLDLFKVGDASGGGNLNVTGGTTTIGNHLVIGYGNSASVGVLTVSGGTVTMNGSSRSLQIGGDFGSATPTQTGKYLQTGGVFNFNVPAGTGGINLGNYGAALFDISGGSFSSTGNPLTVGIREPATVNIAGASTQLTLQSLRFNPAGSGFGNLGHGTANLNGGTLTVGSISRNAGSTAAATFNFNGGTLRAAASNTAFMTGLTYAYVKEGGAKIDTQGFEIVVGQSLLHGGAAATDGGLTKTGGGKLTFTGALSYTGLTAINGGTLVLDNGQTTTLGAISGVGNLSVGPTSTLIAPSINVNALNIGSTAAAVAVPEPAALVLMSIAGILGGLALVRSRMGKRE